LRTLPLDRREEDTSRHTEIADFYDARVANPADLNTRLATVKRAVHHHSGIVRMNEPLPGEDADILAWLYCSEQALCDLVWYLIQGLSQRRPQRMLDLGCGEGGTAARFYELARDFSLEIVGITLSKQQKEMAVRHCPQGQFLVGDMLSVDTLRGRDFDVVYAIESTEYLGPTGLETFMQCAVSWLATRGLLVVVAGSRSPALSPDDPTVHLLNSHYRTQLSSVEDYRRSAAGCGFRLAAEIDLGPVTLPYWRVRRDRSVLRNSEDGMIERTIATALEKGLGDYRLYAWYRGR
jgi:SAM-dependent methyltransferase